MSADPTNIRGGERMFVHRTRFYKGLMTLACAFVLISVSGCGDDASTTATDSSAPAGSTSTSKTAPETDTADADPADLKVIEAWSTALSEGDVKAAAAYFATPSTAENGPVLIKIESLDDAIAFNTTLPCGAEVISAKTQGDFTSATFLLSERPGGGCGSGAGGEASTSFQIENGKIVEWRRIDMPPGSPAGPGDSSNSAPI